MNDDIYNVVSGYVKLEDCGKEYRGKCPFCGKNTLRVRKNSDLFYCETCGTAGNAPKFLSLMEHISYSEACEQLGGVYKLEG